MPGADGGAPTAAFTAALTAAALTATSGAAADEAPSEATLTYVVPDASACPTRDSFENLVAARLGYAPFIDGAPREVAVRFYAEAAELIAEIRLTHGGELVGERVLRAERDACDSLAAAAATAVSIALDPRSSSGPVTPPPPTAEPSPTRPAPRPSPEPTPPAPPPDARVESSTDVGLTGTAYVTGGSWLGVAPGPTLGGRVGAGGRLGNYSLAAEGFLAATPGAAELDSGDAVSAMVVGGGLAPCGHLDPAFGCVVVYVGAFQGEAESVVKPAVKSTLFASTGGRVGVEWPLVDAVLLRADVELMVPLVRTELLVDGAAVWDAVPLYAGATLGLGTRFP